MLTRERQGLAVAVGLLLVMLAGLLAEISYAQRWRGGGGGSFYRPAPTQMQPRTMPVQRPMPSQMQSRPMMQTNRAQPGMAGNRNFSQQQRMRTVRQLPPSIRTTAPIARVPSYTGRVTTVGSPILATRTGRAFAVPQQATFSTRMSLMSGTSRPALMARMGQQRIGQIQTRRVDVARTGSDQLLGKSYTKDFRLSYDKREQSWRSPGGLVYGQGSREGNRVKHVLEHTAPNPGKAKHTVFAVDKRQVLPLVDEAWKKRGSPVVGDSKAYVVPMGRVVGRGGETSIRIVVDQPGSSRLISAYPQ